METKTYGNPSEAVKYNTASQLARVDCRKYTGYLPQQHSTQTTIGHNKTQK